ncbi:MAG TPA: metalloregulator ArsR/SmtB family transcription factor [Tepidisphaeraceae bacterium]|nr:metalloregulator ArsR/SmtB family transcription factor [Tepidisphaeraceae bacterium]
MPNRSPLPVELLVRVAQTFRVLGDPSRLQILQALMSGPRTVNEVAENTNKGQANVSKHLGLLADAGMVSRTPRGTQVVYRIADRLVYRLCDMVCGSVRDQLAKQVEAHRQILKKSG